MTRILLAAALMLAPIPALAHHCEGNRNLHVTRSGAFDFGRRHGRHTCEVSSHPKMVAGNRCSLVRGGNGQIYCN